MNLEALSVVLFPILFGMVLVWFVLMKLLFNRLERVHSEKYVAMGRPSLFLRNSISGGWATLKFLIAREHTTLNDSYLSRLADAMLVFFAIYALLFFSLFFAILGQAIPPAA